MRALVILLVASLAANVFLLATRSTRATHTLGELEPVTGSPPAPDRARAFVPSPKHPASYGVLERVVLEQRVLAAEADLERHRPLDEKYRHDPRSSETEARARPYLDRVFKDLGAYKVECHGRVCKLDPEAPRRDWQEWLQTTMPERMTLFRVMSFSPAGTFLELYTEGEELAAKIRFEAQLAVVACLRDPPPSGDITLQLVMDSGRVKLEASGSLVAQPIGRCLVKALEEAIAKVPVPAGLHVEDEGSTWSFPLE